MTSSFITDADQEKQALRAAVATTCCASFGNPWTVEDCIRQPAQTPLGLRNLATSELYRKSLHEDTPLLPAHGCCMHSAVSSPRCSPSWPLYMHIQLHRSNSSGRGVTGFKME